MQGILIHYVRGMPGAIGHPYLVVVVGEHSISLEWFSGVTLECCSWPTEVTVKGLWQMIFGFSRNNHLLDSFLGRLLAGKIKVGIVNVLLMLVLLNVGSVTRPADCAFGTQVLGLSHLGSSHPQHIVCGLPWILFTMPDSHLILSLRRRGRPACIQPCRGGNIEIDLREGTGVHGQMEGKRVILGSECVWTCREDESRSMAGLCLRYGWVVRGEDQDMMLRSLLGTTSWKGPLSQQGNWDFILKATDSHGRFLRWKSDVYFGNRTLKQQQHPKFICGKTI